MHISDIIGLFAGLIGSTATLLGAWAYVRSQHPPKKELLRAGLVVIVIMISILGIAVGISRATTITVNGQKTLPVPGFEKPANTTPAPALPSVPTLVPTLSSTPASSSTPTPSSTPASSSTPTPSSTPASSSTPRPSSTPASSSSTPTSSSMLTPSSTPTATKG